MRQKMSPLLTEGLNLAFYGMGTVFLFLTLLVFATQLMSWLTLRATPTIKTADFINNKKLAAITAAVHQHRKRK